MGHHSQYSTLIGLVKCKRVRVGGGDPEPEDKRQKKEGHESWGDGRGGVSYTLLLHVIRPERIPSFSGPGLWLNKAGIWHIMRRLSKAWSLCFRNEDG